MTNKKTPLNSDEYLTIREPGYAELKVKGSRFIGVATPVTTRASAQEVLAQIRKKYYDATHHCFAWRIGWETNLEERYSDAGEPAGTAGLPIFQVIAGRELTNILVVVTRYFGGTKLGKGGLVRAYRDTTIATLDQIQPVSQILNEELTIHFPYAQTGDVMHLIQSQQVKIIAMDYGNDARIVLQIRKTLADNLRHRLIEITQNKITFEK